MSMTRGHLANQPGVRGHSASPEFARSGVVQYIKLDPEVPGAHWVYHMQPNGLVSHVEMRAVAPKQAELDLRPQAQANRGDA